MYYDPMARAHYEESMNKKPEIVHMDRDEMCEILENSLIQSELEYYGSPLPMFVNRRNAAIRRVIDENVYLTDQLRFAREEIALLNQHKENAEKEIARLMSQTENELNRAEVIRRHKSLGTQRYVEAQVKC